MLNFNIKYNIFTLFLHYCLKIACIYLLPCNFIDWTLIEDNSVEQLALLIGHSGRGFNTVEANK